METLAVLQGMHDTSESGPDHECLFDVASGQHGYFRSAQARACGVGWDVLSRGAAGRGCIRIRRGLYRRRNCPSWPREEVVAGWLAAGKDVAVVSHDSALDLHDLSDVIPNAVHLTVPRSMRYLKGLPGVVLHTTTRSLEQGGIVVRHGVRVTSPARTILDAAERGTGPEQIHLAIAQALGRGIVTRHALGVGARRRGGRVAALVDGAIEHAVGKGDR